MGMTNPSRTFLLAALFVSLLLVSVAYHSGRRSTRVGDIDITGCLSVEQATELIRTTDVVMPQEQEQD